MSLSRAILDGVAVPLPGKAPFSCRDLAPLHHRSFDLPCEDPFLRGAGTPAHAYLEGAKEGWHDHPEYMDFLDPTSPVFALKTAERDLTMHHWEGWLEAARVLDVGCGSGRFAMPFLDRGATVVGVDGDHESLRRCVWHAAGRPGRLDVHWSSVRSLPAIEPVDVVIAAEVLCYVPDLAGALAAIRARLRPGGGLLLSVEARWGWAASPDAPVGAVEAALGGEGVVHIPGDRWVRTMDREQLEAALSESGFQVERIRATHYLTDGPLEGVLGECSLAEILELEQRCRAHPVWRPLNRLWTAVAVRS